jgi:dihydrofolate reductase
MNPPVIALIAALARNRTIGAGNKMPWHLPEDLRRFKQLTTGHRIIMGRKTFESIGRPLPGRTNVIVTRLKSLAAPGCTIVHTLEEAFAVAGPPDTMAFVIGGGDIYAQTMSYASKMYLTEIDAEIAGDAFFPPFDRNDWIEIRRERRTTNEALSYSFVDYDRR